MSGKKEECMRSLFLSAVASMAMVGVAHADLQISIGGSTNGGLVTFIGSGTNNISITVGSISGNALDPTETNGGIYTFGPLGTTLFTATATPGVWNAPAGTTIPFTYTNGSNVLDETLTITSINDGSANPHFAGTDVVTNISGSSAFVTEFGGIGRTSIWDLAVSDVTKVNNNTGVVLDTLAMTTNSESVGLSSGQLVPNAVPEPASIALLGTGLLGFGMLRLRRKR